MKPLPLALVLASLVACGPKEADSVGETTSGSSGDATGGSTVIVASDTDPATTKGADECPDPNSTYSDGKCFCTADYDWCSPDDPNDLSCCPTTTTAFPSTSGPDPTASDATAEVTTAPVTTGDTTTGDTTTGDVPCGTPPPDRCDPNGETRYCDSGQGCELADSTLYKCDGGLWQPAPAAADALCKEQGHDFAFGCVAGSPLHVECGDGPGTACAADDPGFCTDMVTVQACQHGKLADTDCNAACIAGQVDDLKHDGGYCVQSRISSHCGCCDGADCP